MKILAIRGKNIASLEGEFSIDFTVEPLLTTGIFAISGPTGAGKSTLLDTMCLALFARTPRTSQAKENKVYVKDVNEDVLIQGDPRFLLRRGTPSGYAEVDFLGLTGHNYRARWSVGRAREKEDGRLQNYRVSLFNLDKEEEEQGSRSDIQNRILDLIGLTFDQFTRSVLLAQNDFSTFLKAEQGEKASLLEKLTGTGHYSRISRLVFEKTGEAKSAYDQLASRIRGIELLPEEVEKELQETLQEAEKQLERLGTLKTSRQELTDKVQQANRSIQTKKDQQKETSTSLDRLLTQLVETNKQLEEKKEAQVKAESDYKKIKPDMDQAVKLDVEIRSYLPVVEEARKHCEQVEDSVKKKSEQVLLSQKQLQEGETQVKVLKDWFLKYQDKEKVARQMDALLIHLDDAFAVKQQFQRSEQKVAALLSGRKEQELQLEKVLRLVCEKETLKQQAENQLKEERKKSETVSREQIEQEIMETRNEREKLLLEKARFIVTGDIRSLRDKLADDEPCPVCGSCDHPYASPAVYEEANEREKQIAALTLRLEVLEKQLQAYQKSQTEMGRIQQLLVQHEKELSVCKQEAAEWQSKGTLFAGQLEAEQQFIAEQQKRLERSLQATSALFGSEEWQKNWLSDPEGFRSKLVAFTNEWNQKRELQQAAEKQVEVSRKELEINSELLEKEKVLFRDAGEKYQEKEKVYTTLLAERGKLLEGRAVQEVESAMAGSIEECRKQTDLLQNRLREQSTQVDRAKGILSQVTKELEEAEKEWQEQTHHLQVWIEANNTSPEGFTIEQDIDRLTKQKNEYSFRLRMHAENLKKVAGFRKELDSCREKYEQWGKLNELVGSSDGSKFRKIAQGYTLDVLINYANVQLKNLTHRYRLERVPDTLALQVIDRDMCDEVRTVHSLSGGESFLVSLALALGLSSLSSNRMKVESLFIDEGFGSLDTDTLRIAMDALESLRTQGRKIGVISHVQEMTERIPVQVKVCRSGNGRSYLEIS